MGRSAGSFQAEVMKKVELKERSLICSRDRREAVWLSGVYLGESECGDSSGGSGHSEVGSTATIQSRVRIAGKELSKAPFIFLSIHSANLAFCFILVMKSL